MPYEFLLPVRTRAALCPEMPEAIRRSTTGFPVRFAAVLAVAAAFGAFLTFDQMHWWVLKPDYAFGWLVPVLAAYVAYDRWPRLRANLASGYEPIAGWMGAVGPMFAGGSLIVGVSLFLLGALYRAGAGSTQPGSLMLACGFPGILFGMVYFNVPARACPASGTTASGWRALAADMRWRTVGIFLFPALIWVLSAPLVSAVENAISLFLLRRVVEVVFTVFSLLGYPLVQEGNVLLLPQGRVGVADACSGIRSLTACLFAGSFLAAVFLDRFWKKFLLVASAMALAFFTNLLRSVFLTAWAYAYGSEAIEGSLHDTTGYAVLGLTVVGLFVLLPLFNAANWRRWLQAAPAEAPAATADALAGAPVTRD